MFDYTGIQVDTNNSGSTFDWTGYTNDPWYFYTLGNADDSGADNGQLTEQRPQPAAPQEVNLDNELE
ncbi:hypothetical protein [[Erwinia] mediterraneensis]|uniref:hypothetical protein n=1 Tax=[Erwinia] mediterraneensis TaxID=2161819 RepID=UPI0010304C80|nr:hypothetical protein [[Erwinia] mediterraneensis]